MVLCMYEFLRVIDGVPDYRTVMSETKRKNRLDAFGRCLEATNPMDVSDVQVSTLMGMIEETKNLMNGTDSDVEKRADAIKAFGSKKRRRVKRLL